MAIVRGGLLTHYVGFLVRQPFTVEKFVCAATQGWLAPHIYMYACPFCSLVPRATLGDKRQHLDEWRAVGVSRYSGHLASRLRVCWRPDEYFMDLYKPRPYGCHSFITVDYASSIWTHTSFCRVGALHRGHREWFLPLRQPNNQSSKIDVQYPIKNGRSYVSM